MLRLVFQEFYFYILALAFAVFLFLFFFFLHSIFIFLHFIFFLLHFHFLLFSLVTSDGDEVDAVSVVFLGERHWKNTTRISCPVGVPDMLSLVDMSASHVVRMIVPSFQVHFLLSADDDLFARILFGYV